MNGIFEKNNIKLFGFLPFESVKNNLINCKNKSLIPEKAKTVIVMLFPYFSYNLKKGNLSKYASVKDYHQVLKELSQNLLKDLGEKYPDEEFIFFSDNSPINEIEAAVSCGLGVKGKNGLLINEKYGSYLFIGEIITTLELENYTISEEKSCLCCGLCQKVCPENAISEGKVNIDKCLSHINQKKGDLTSFEKELILKTNYIWGCDICQDICPMNKNILETFIPDFKKDIKENLFYEDIINLSNKTFCEKYKDRAFTFRGVSVLKRNLNIIKDQNQ
ncbi:MAG: epoxyqueuosine reductase [Clostridia bacterium]|nr:epoxyqueuosine reductase [Clostridia bacterium]